MIEPAMRIAILTPAEDYYVDWQSGADDFRRMFGDSLSLRPWRDPGRLDGFDLVMPLLAWGYQQETELWDASLEEWQGLPFANSIETLRWNTNKRYLLELEAKGLTIVPTLLAQSLGWEDIEAAHLRFGDGAMIVKPTISGGAEGTYLLRRGDPVPTDVAGREMLVQPLVPAIADEGEYSLFYFGGTLSHTILKRPASGDFRVQEQFGGIEGAAVPPLPAMALAGAVLNSLKDVPLYARVDMVRSADDSFQLMELELIEPSLFLHQAPDRGAMFARAVRRQVEKNRGG